MFFCIQDDDTIVLDDSQDDEEVATRSDSPDSVIVLEEREEGELTASVAEGTNESVQVRVYLEQNVFNPKESSYATWKFRDFEQDILDTYLERMM